jgi:cyclase
MSSSRNIRVISRLDVKSGYVIKGIQMEGLRRIGDPNDFATKYYNEGIDEILLIDAVASLYNRNLLEKVIEEITSNIYCPITVGGGVRSIEDAKNLFKHGADKIAINSCLFENPILLNQLVSEFGSEAIVLSIEAKKLNDKYYAYFNSGKDDSGIELNSWIDKCLNSSPGQILLTSVDKDGIRNGYDLDLLNYINDPCISLIASGGIGNLDHIEKTLSFDFVSAIAIGSAFHYKKLEIKSVKDQIRKMDFDVRLM